ncbi:uncharacterized protein LOC129591777 [Paramacrobiotus metropolitanus]|uniref:uncharacterized protein LOC129591777 n=1 Tax=Paramacrobiotus metropolitanus TaxID=2943436 RepID=UPI0024456DA9|nr:uncharacterized protein LOC129591777 [Paramacrobiotus metropolitanus]
MVVLASDSTRDDAAKKSLIEKELGGRGDTEESGANADEESSESDDDVPALEENEAAEGSGAAGAGRKGAEAAAAGEGNLDLSGAGNVHIGKQSRGEKKARKVLLKLGLKPVPGVTKVTIRKSKNILFVIHNPDVYRHPGSDHYIIFGEAKIEDMGHQASLQSLERLRNTADFGGDERKGLDVGGPGGDKGEGSKEGGGPGGATTKIEESDDEAGVEPDETGLDSGDINLVMTQAGVKRSRAVKALKRNDGDIVNAIMELTM